MKDGSQAPISSEGPCYWEKVKYYSDYPRTIPLAKPDVTGFLTGYPLWAKLSPMRRPSTWKIYLEEKNGTALVIGPGGNSFSGPHAAGVAALMLSANPDVPAWKVKELMEATCTDIGEEGHDDK